MLNLRLAYAINGEILNFWQLLEIGVLKENCIED